MGSCEALTFSKSAMFSYLWPEQTVPADHPLRAIREITDRVLKQLSRHFSGMYARVGRPSIQPQKLLRALLLEVRCTIRSERMLMEQLDHNLLFRWFVGLTLDEKVWSDKLRGGLQDSPLLRSPADISLPFARFLI